MSADVITFDILINGIAIDSSTEITSLEVEQNNTKNIARVELETDSDKYPIPVKSGFKLGDDIEIKLGYNNENPTVIKGKITDKVVRLSQGVGAKNIFICEEDAPKHNSGSYTINADDVFNIDLGCNANNKVEGGIEIKGASVRPGTKVTLNKVVEGFPSAPVHSIMHEISEGNWFTSLHFIELQEDSKIELSTKNGNKIVLDDENNAITIQDTNGSSLVFSDNGITINSPKDINITATQNTTIKGDLGTTLQASSGDVQVKGMNTNISADMQASVKGGASAEVQGGAQLTLKGAMVMIN